MARKAFWRVMMSILLCGIIFLPLLTASQTQPNREDELHTLINEKTSSIKKLEEEIAQYQIQLKAVEGEKQTLQNQIKSLDITRKKLIADLAITENKIGKTNLELEGLSIDIKDKEGRINTNRSAIADGLRLIHDHDNTSFLENLLSKGALSDVWEDIDAIETIQHNLQKHIETLQTVKNDLENKQEKVSKVKNELTNLSKELSGRKKVIEYNTKEKNTLLTSTKNSEANYKKLLQEKVALRDAFEKELLDFELELKFIIDPSSIPEVRHNTLSWPVEEPYITQRFGNTAFAQANAHVYNGHGHNGIDLRAAVGARIKAALEGIVADTGDTDVVCLGASYGKWVLLTHPNGLSTLYAHLSVISVDKGDQVPTGATLGYSGTTGYSTGPHLHFTVYATQGVKVMERKSRVCGGIYRMPIADLRAYLDPLPYLPSL